MKFFIYFSILLLLTACSESNEYKTTDSDPILNATINDIEDLIELCGEKCSDFTPSYLMLIDDPMGEVGTTNIIYECRDDRFPYCRPQEEFVDF